MSRFILFSHAKAQFLEQILELKQVETHPILTDLILVSSLTLPEKIKLELKELIQKRRFYKLLTGRSRN